MYCVNEFTAVVVKINYYCMDIAVLLKKQPSRNIIGKLTNDIALLIVEQKKCVDARVYCSTDLTHTVVT